MKVIRFLVLLVSLTSVGVLAQAQTQKIGYADWEYIFSQMPEYKQVTSELQSHQTKLANQYNAKVSEFETKMKNYNDNLASMLDVVRKNTETELQRMNQDIQQFEQEAQASLEEKQNTLMQPVFTKVGNAITEVAKENGYAFILSPAIIGGGDILLYSDEQYDISDLVLKKLGITPSPAAGK